MQMNCDLDTHSREQRYIVSRVIKLDIDRDTLADFSVVATAVIRGRQQRELTGGSSDNLCHMAGDRAVIGIDMNIRSLAFGNVFDGAFINIGGDLHTIGIGFLCYRGGSRIHELTNSARNLHNDPIHRGNQVLYRRGADGPYGANNLSGAHRTPYLDIQVNERARGRWHNVDHRACDLGIVSGVEVVAIVNKVAYHPADKNDRQDDSRNND